MDEKIKVGDVVRPKSGGPDMNVEAIVDLTEGFDGKDEIRVTCFWFDGTKRMQGSFPLQTLELVRR
jgi:uncharacterized protein YodC (DUF2158 family)